MFATNTLWASLKRLCTPKGGPATGMYRRCTNHPRALSTGWKYNPLPQATQKPHPDSRNPQTRIRDKKSLPAGDQEKAGKERRHWASAGVTAAVATGAAAAIAACSWKTTGEVVPKSRRKVVENQMTGSDHC